VGGAVGDVWMRTFVASYTVWCKDQQLLLGSKHTIGASKMSAMNSALADAAKYRLVRHWYAIS